ncbi:unnamed protein product [Eruca vesicaria subsp. sativa]|uniref:Integrator complex subunit 4/Protein SIEL C-terminal Ig-like domain-containing protein n=1 Tax=Eruca vesicaria subsp. sativa TaxID=29727 RepID=A0ABC8M520_ERUVS|nr:unnamed protein product [Eruca vesicaria subsp. sativa]
MEEDDSVSLTLHTLSSIRSIIINAHTPLPVISSIFDFLTRLLSQNNSTILHHVLKLLSDLSLSRNELSPQIFDSILSNFLQTSTSSDGIRVAGESLAVLASISERNPNVAAFSRIDGEVFASICIGADVASRMWMIRNAERFNVPSSVVFTLCFGFTKDPYPFVRKVAIDGLVCVCESGGFDHVSAVKGCYARAVELLGDAEDSVRASAVRAVSVWGKVLIASKEESNRRECSDAVFLQLCSVVRDMSVDVRVEVFKAFGVIGTASESIILQTLSKKVLKAGKGKKPQDHLSNEFVDAAAAAGVFIHGFEDEFYEVREAAVDSFHSLSVNSIEFPDEAVCLLMDMLYDDYMVVRLKALEALHHIADVRNLKIQETYLPAFLDAIIDTSENIRLTARNILKLAKLPDLKLVNKCVDGVLKSLEMYPQDEPNILSTLFQFGQNHTNSLVSIIKRFNEKLETDSGNRCDFISRQVSAFLMVIISAPLSNKQSVTSIPPLAFSYSLAMLGKFSCGLHDMMDQDTLLAYLAHCITLSASSGTEFNKADMFLNAYRRSTSDHSEDPVLLPRNIPAESKPMASVAELEIRDPALNSVCHIQLRVKAAWLLLKSECSNEAFRALRACKQELATLTANSSVSNGALEFMCQYVHLIEILTQVWPHFEYSRHTSTCRSVEVELLMEELDLNLMEIRCRFTGLSTELSLVMELVILSCLLRLYKFEICYRLSCKKKLSSTVSQLELHHEQQCTKPSDFLTETTKSLQEIGSSADISCCRLLDLIKKFNCFSPEQFTLSTNLKCVSAELEVPGNGPYHPISFVAGLPVAIPCEIKLLNVPRDARLWLRISRSDDTCQFVYIDPNLYSGDEREKRFMFTAVTCKTPRAVVFTLRVSIGVECLFEDVCSGKHRYGPKHPLVYLCKQREVHFSFVSRTKAL